MSGDRFHQAKGKLNNFDLARNGYWNCLWAAVLRQGKDKICFQVAVDDRRRMRTVMT
jgi:hypothetical protein